MPGSLEMLMPLSDDSAIDSLAAEHFGLVTHAQLVELGMRPGAIARRVRCKRLHRLYRGVYRVGPLVAPHTRERAAALACGPHAVVSHISAGWLWQLLPDPGDAALVDVSLRRGDRNRPGVCVHRVRLRGNEVTVLQNIPITTIGRTLSDLAGLLRGVDLERALARAERNHQLPLGDLSTRHGQRPGAPVLRALLRKESGPALTRSEAEDRFLALVRKSQLPVPACNTRVAGCEVDFFWRRERVVVEVDGYAVHSSRRAFENDRRRDARLAADGVRVIRVTWRQIVNEPEALLVRLAQVLASTGADRRHG